MDPRSARTEQGQLDSAAVETLGTSLRGRLIGPDHEDYDAARKVWNGMIDRKPALIARCAGAADVIQAVNFARTHDLLVSVRGGGHNVAGNAVCDDGIVVDLSSMKGIRVNPTNRTVRAEPGLTWREFDRETQAFGLATTGGFISTTGIAGLTLGGGLGWLMRSYGLACDNVLSVDLVKANGQFLTASSTENQDLFWGIRGGGGNFGVVTSFEYQLHPVGPMVLGGAVAHPLPKAKEAFQFYREYTEAAPEQLTTYAALGPSPDGVPVAVLATCYNGSLEKGQQIVRPLQEFGPPVADMIAPIPYTALQSMFDALYPSRRLSYWKSSFLRELSDDAIGTMIEFFTDAPSPFSAVALEELGGVVSRVSKEDTAFGDRSAHYSLIITSEWTDPAESERNIRWARDLWKAMQPFARDAVYVNYLDSDEQNRTEAAYGPENYTRLLALKNKYDPTNLFRMNQNIKPTV